MICVPRNFGQLIRSRKLASTFRYVCRNDFASMSLPFLPDVEQLSPYVTRILGCNPGPFTLQGTNTYLIGHPNTKERLILDTGTGLPEYAAKLKNYLTEHNLWISTVIVTHSHHDHILGVTSIREVYPEVKILKYMDAYQIEYDEIDPAIFTHWADGEEIEAAGLHFTAYFTPGHCDDHISVWLQEEGALFSGDNLLGHGSTVFNDYTLYTKSLIRMRDLPRLSIVYPGHGVVITDGVLAFNRYLEHRRQRENDILKALRAHPDGLSTEEIVKNIYDNLDTREGRIKLAAIGNTVQYLSKLADEKKVEPYGFAWRLAL